MKPSEKQHSGFDFGNIEANPRREFYVETPMGKLKVYAKHEKDHPTDYPGVFVDFVEPDGEQILLACVEFDSCEDRLQTCVYGDANSEAPTEVVHHENLSIDRLDPVQGVVQV